MTAKIGDQFGALRLIVIFRVISRVISETVTFSPKPYLPNAVIRRYLAKTWRVGELANIQTDSTRLTSPLPRVKCRVIALLYTACA